MFLRIINYFKKIIIIIINNNNNNNNNNKTPLKVRKWVGKLKEINVSTSNIMMFVLV